MAGEYSFHNSTLYLALMQGHKRLLRKNQVFLTTDNGDTINIIKEGYVKRYKITHAGTESIQGIYGPSDVLPLTWMFKELLALNLYLGTETFYYEPLTNATVCTILSEDLIELSNQKPEIYKDIAYITGMRLRTYIHNFENMSLDSAEKRLAHQLLFLAENFGQKTLKGTQILVPFKQKELASLIDMARETVTINLKALRSKGLIGESSDFIPDIDKLREFAYK